MLWAGNDLCWTALSQTISLNDAEEEPFNLSWKLINFSPCLSCVCVRARKCGRQPVRESRLSVRVLIVFPHARSLSDGSKHPDTTALYQRQGATSQIYYRVSWGPLHGPVPRPDVFLFFLLSYPRGLFVLTKGNWRWILSGEQEAARTCQEQRKTNGRRRKSWLKRQMVLRIQSKQRRHVSMHVWAGVCTFHCWI